MSAALVGPVPVAIPTHGVLMEIEEDLALNYESYAKDAMAVAAVLAEKVKALGPIQDMSDAHERVELSSRIALALKGLEDTRVKAVRPWNTKVRALNETIAKVVEPCQALIDTVKRAKSAWDQHEIARERREREELERQKREAAAREAAAQAKLDAARTAKQREKAQAEADAASANQAAIETEAPRPAVTGLKGDFGGMSSRKVWVAEVVDPAMVPREYLVVDEAKIRAAVKAGARVIPGVNIYEDTQQVQRTR